MRNDSASADFNPSEWFTERSYSNQTFEILPSGPGVYVLVDINIDTRPFIYNVLYVGMSSNLSQRFKNHAIYKYLCEIYDVFIYFKPLKDQLRDKEKELIWRFNPPFNLQHRRRGI